MDKSLHLKLRKQPKDPNAQEFLSWDPQKEFKICEPGEPEGKKKKKKHLYFHLLLTEMQHSIQLSNRPGTE